MFKRSIYKHYMCSVCFLCSLQDSLSLLLSHCSRPGRSCLAPPPLYYGSRTLWTIRHIGTHRRPKIIAQTLKKTDCLFVCKHLWFCLSPSSPLCTSYNDFYVTLVCGSAIYNKLLLSDLLFCSDIILSLLSNSLIFPITQIFCCCVLYPILPLNSDVRT